MIEKPDDVEGGLGIATEDDLKVILLSAVIFKLLRIVLLGSANHASRHRLECQVELASSSGKT